MESGKRSDRPKLAEALRLCRVHGATLIIAKLDRLARNVAFVSNLMRSGVEFTAVDFPQANRLTVHILAAVAEHEAKMISERTKAALKAAKARGKKLGGHRGVVLSDEHRAAGRAAQTLRGDEPGGGHRPCHCGPQGGRRYVSGSRCTRPQRKGHSYGARRRLDPDASLPGARKAGGRGSRLSEGAMRHAWPIAVRPAAGAQSDSFRLGKRRGGHGGKLRPLARGVAFRVGDPWGSRGRKPLLRSAPPSH